MFTNLTGVGFMKSMIAFSEQRRIYNENGPKIGASYMKNGKRTYSEFKWEGNDLVTDNKDIYISATLPGMIINEGLANKMDGSCGEKIWT